MKISEELVFVGNIPIHRKRANSEKRKSEEVKETNSDGTLPLEPPHKVSRPSEVSTSASQQISLQEVDLSSSSSSIDPVTPNTTTFSSISPIHLLESKEIFSLFETCPSPISLANPAEQKTVPHIFDCSFLSQPDGIDELSFQNMYQQNYLHLCDSFQYPVHSYSDGTLVEGDQLVNGPQEIMEIRDDIFYEALFDDIQL